jgi:hypothetical protein
MLAKALSIASTCMFDHKFCGWAAVWEIADPIPIIRKLVGFGLLEAVEAGRFQNARVACQTCELAPGLSSQHTSLRLNYRDVMF